MHSGVETKAAYTFEAGNYGVATLIAPGDQIHFNGESLRPTQQNANDDYFNLTGRGYSLTDQIFKSVGGNISIEAYYDDINLIAAALGLSNLDTSPADLLGGAWQHSFYFDDDKADRLQDARDKGTPNPAKPMKRRGTLAIDKGANVWQYPSAMVNTMTLNADAVGGVGFNFGIISRDIGMDQSTNTSSQFWEFKNPSDRDKDKVFFEDIKVWMADVTDPFPQDSSNLVCLSSFSITFDSHLSIQNDRETNTLISQPWGRLGTITGNFNFPFFSDAQETTQIQKLLDAEKVRIIVEFISDTTIASSAFKYGYTIDLKQVFLTTGGADVSGPGVIPTQLNFIADRTPIASITDVPNDVEFLIRNQVSSNPLEY